MKQAYLLTLLFCFSIASFAQVRPVIGPRVNISKIKIPGFLNDQQKLKQSVYVGKTALRTNSNTTLGNKRSIGVFSKDPSSLELFADHVKYMSAYSLTLGEWGTIELHMYNVTKGLYAFEVNLAPDLKNTEPLLVCYGSAGWKEQPVTPINGKLLFLIECIFPAEIIRIFNPNKASIDYYNMEISKVN